MSQPRRPLSAHRTSNLQARITTALGEAKLHPPFSSESEPQFTRRVLAPIVREVLNTLPGLNLHFRGDGGDEQAIPASMLGVEFFPDLAVSAGQQHVWAAEVKFLKSHARQSSIATAVGQATIYRRRYSLVSVILVDLAPSLHGAFEDVVQFAKTVGLHTVFASVIGPSVMSYSTRD